MEKNLQPALTLHQAGKYHPIEVEWYKTRPPDPAAILIKPGSQMQRKTWE